MIWLITYIVGICVAYSVLNRWNTTRDEDDFFAASFFEGMVDGVIMAGRVIFWPIWLAWLYLSAILGWLCWLTGLNDTNRQRIYENTAITVLISWLFISQLWEKDEEDEGWRWYELAR